MKHTKRTTRKRDYTEAWLSDAGFVGIYPRTRTSADGLITVYHIHVNHLHNIVQLYHTTAFNPIARDLVRRAHCVDMAYAVEYFDRAQVK